MRRAAANAKPRLKAVSPASSAKG